MSAGAYRVHYLYGSLVLLGVAIGCDVLARRLPAIEAAAHGLAFWLAVAGNGGVLWGLVEVVRRWP